MGERDISKLHVIYSEIQKLNIENGWKFFFRVDSGSFETAIQVEDDNRWHLPRIESKAPIIVPDLADFAHKLVIEFEEEAKPNSGYLGAKKNKGHFPELLNPRDSERDLLYKRIQFDLLKIWESSLKSHEWKDLLKIFLSLHAANVQFSCISK